MSTLRRILPLATAAAIAAPLFAHEADNFKLLASDGLDGDAFGSAVAIDGLTAMVAAPLADGIGVDSGAIYVFTFDGAMWNEVAKLTASNAAAGDLFGSAISLQGSRMVVGAPGANAGDGAAYAFSFDGVNWNETTMLAPAGLAAGAGFGASLDLDGSSAVIGATDAAYVFVDGGLGWAQEASLTSAAHFAGDLFGRGVTISGDLAAIGAPSGNGNVAGSGVVNIFSRSAGVWTEGQTLSLLAANTGDRYGEDLDMYGGVELLIGAPGADIGAVDTGGGERYALLGGTWTINATYKGRDAGDCMGAAIVLHKRYNVLGTPFDDDETLDGGTTSRFLKGSTTPLEVWVAHDSGAGDALGTSCDVGDIWAINGAPNHDFGLGTAYIHSSVQAIVLHLDGTFVNPDILTTVSGPVIGQSWDMAIDLTLFPDSERTRIIIKKNPAPAPIMTVFGEVFFKPSDPTLLVDDALGAHSIQVPNNESILDREFTLMGVVYGSAANGFPVLSLTNGQTVTIGTTDFPINVAAPHTP